MKIRAYQCECLHAVFPWGKGAPVCTLGIEQTGNLKDVKNCIEKGCVHKKVFKFISDENTERIKKYD